uniref:Uncharacterized protein n=1 Tax=Glossina brevipalpis TaxID=37001 RepID=A0A1A9WN10_9MUSC
MDENTILSNRHSIRYQEYRGGGAQFSTPRQHISINKRTSNMTHLAAVCVGVFGGVVTVAATEELAAAAAAGNVAKYEN